MKKNFISLLLTTGAIATLVTFHACSSDEANDPQPMSKSQLLLKKSKEFAQKYNVDLEVDETQLEKVADTLSVEQMERDYQAWANLNAHIKMQNSTKVRTSKSLKLKRKRAAFESTAINGHYEHTATNNKSINVIIDYNFGNSGSGLVHVRISYKGSDGQASFIPIGYTFYGSDECEFTATGSVFLSGGLYKGLMHVWIEHRLSGEIICNVNK